MAVRIVDAPIDDFVGEQVTAEGNPSTTAANRRSINVPQGALEVLMEVSGAQDARIALCGKIRRVYHYDASEDTWIDLLADGPNAIIDSSQTGITSFILAAADYLYIATARRVGGYRLLIPTTQNSNAATTTFEYSSGGNSFTATADTDGTESGGNMFTQSGNITMDTVPAEGVWQAIDLKKAAPSYPVEGERLYWTRIQPSALLTAVVITQLSTLQWDVADTTGKWHAGKFKTITEYTIDFKDHIGSLEYASAHASTTTTIEFSWIFR